MNKIKSLALGGLAALVIGCSSYKHLQRDNTNKLFLINSHIQESTNDPSRYNFDGFINGRYVFFNNYPKMNFLNVADTSLRIAYRFFDSKERDMKIDSVVVLVGGYYHKQELRLIMDEKVFVMEKTGPEYAQYEAFTKELHPQVISQMQTEFNRYLNAIINTKSTLAYKIMNAEKKKK